MNAAPDRQRSLARLDAAMRRAIRYERPLAAMRVDVDGIASIAGSRGDGAALAARQACADRLRRATRESDELWAVGGDAYLAILEVGRDESELDGAAKRLIETVAATDPALCASVGVAVFPDDGLDPADLLLKAGAAATAAASSGGGTACWFREEHRPGSVPPTLRARLAAPSPAFLEVRYEPVVDARGGGIVAARAFLEWRGTPAAPHPPRACLDRRADGELLGRLDAFVLAEVLRAIEHWGPAAPRVHLVGACASEATVALLGAPEARAAASRRRLCVEFDEETIADDVESSRMVSRRLGRLGVVVAVAAFAAPRPPLDALAAVPLDVIAVDVRGDLRALAAIGAAASLAPRILATAVADPGARERVARSGADELAGPAVGEAGTAITLFDCVPRT